MTDTTALPVRPASFDELTALIGKELGPTDWHDVTQERVNAFADATGDHQWIHIDPERAAASPLGGTIAHGLYSLPSDRRCRRPCCGSTVSPTA